MVFDDDITVLRWASTLLAQHGVHARTTAQFADVASLRATTDINVFVLDRFTDRHDHLEDIQRLKRRCSNSGVMVMSNVGEKPDICEGLLRGADDYMRKPLHPDEFVARVLALGRRYSGLTNIYISFGKLSISAETGAAKIADCQVSLTLGERSILRTLAVRKNRVVLRDDLLSCGAIEEFEIGSNSVDAQVSRIRKKLSDAEAWFEIRAMRGVGYIMCEK
jgi:DNA-binding response OmpR family regulator